jgi:hypothetical protein
MVRSFGSPAFSGVWARPLAFRPRLTACLALSGTPTTRLFCLVSPPALDYPLHHSKVHSTWNIHLSLKQSTFCGPQRSQNVQAHRRGMHGRVKHRELIRRGNASDFLSHIAALGVWENTWPMRLTGMGRVVIRQEFRHSLGFLVAADCTRRGSRGRNTTSATSDRDVRGVRPLAGATVFRGRRRSGDP